MSDESKKLSRREDDSTSHVAAAKLVKSGKHETKKSRVFAALVQYPETTHSELSHDSGIADPTCWRRLSDLMNDGVVIKCGTRVCRVTGNKCNIWRVLTPDEIAERAKPKPAQQELFPK